VTIHHAAAYGTASFGAAAAIKRRLPVTAEEGSEKVVAVPEVAAAEVVRTEKTPAETASATTPVTAVTAVATVIRIGASRRQPRRGCGHQRRHANRTR
jgi:hypothetical protein